MKPKLIVFGILFFGLILCQQKPAEAGIGLPVSFYTRPGDVYTAVPNGVYSNFLNPTASAVASYPAIGITYLYTRSANANVAYPTGEDEQPFSRRVTGTHFFTGVVLTPNSFPLRLLPFRLAASFYFSQYDLPGVEIRTPERTQQGTFDAHDRTIMISIARPDVFFHPRYGRFSMGLKVTFISQKAGPSSSSRGISSDIGGLYELPDQFRLGLVIRNFYSRINGPDKYLDHLEQENVWSIAFPRQISMSDTLLTAFDIVRKNSLWSMNIGIEYSKRINESKWIAIRGGIGHSFSQSKEKNSDLDKSVILKGYGHTSPVLGLSYTSHFMGHTFYKIDYSIDMDQSITTIGRRQRINLSFEFR